MNRMLTAGFDWAAAPVSRKRYLDGFRIMSALDFSHVAADTKRTTRLPRRRYVVERGAAGPAGMTMMSCAASFASRAVRKALIRSRMVSSLTRALKPHESSSCRGGGEWGGFRDTDFG